MRYLEDFRIGQTYQLGDHTVTVAEILAFANQWDPQRFHIDPDEARNTPFGGLIASGWHTASIFMRLYVTTLLRDSSGIGSPGVDEIRWNEPVHPGDTLTATLKVENITPSLGRPDRGTVKPRCELTNQHGRSVLTMYLHSNFLRRPAPDHAGEQTVETAAQPMLVSPRFRTAKSGMETLGGSRMSHYALLAYTPSVQRQQAQHGSARANVARLRHGPDPDRLGPDEREFIAARDGFYLATVSQTGWPYLQFRGGPPGFLHVLDDRTLAFADVRGNRQYITIGNLDTDDRVALFFMDYACQRRLKLFGHASHQALDEDPSLASRLNDIRTDGHVERIVVVSVEGLDWNCPRHITPRFTIREIAPAINELKERITELERENARLRCETTARRHT